MKDDAVLKGHGGLLIIAAIISGALKRPEALPLKKKGLAKLQLQSGADED